MKKYIILLVLLFNASLGFSQAGGPPNVCPCCEENYLDEFGNPLPGYTECTTACADGDDPCASVVPIDSSILILFVLGISFGTFIIYQTNKKRQFEN